MVNIDKGYDYFQEAYAVLEKTWNSRPVCHQAGLPYEQVKAENGAVLDKVNFYAYCTVAQRRSRSYY